MPVVDTSLLRAGDDEVPIALVVWDMDSRVVDQRVTDEILPELRRRLAGWRVLTEDDDEMAPRAGGNRSDNALMQARKAKRLLLLFTPRLVQSEWMMYLVQSFMTVWGPFAHSILPVIIEPCAIPDALALGQAVDCTREMDWLSIERFVKGA